MALRHGMRGPGFGVFCALSTSSWATRAPAQAVAAQLWGQDARVAYARQLCAAANVTCRFAVGIRDPEGFRVTVAGGGKATVQGGGPAGILYGVQELLRARVRGHLPNALRGASAPDFPVRGNALLLMKEANYNYQLTPTEFPWFFDRPLMTRYLDYLFENRFNTVFLWSGNLFPSIVEMPEYPDSTDLPHEQLQRNHEQFAWFTRECAKRNIAVLLHFYQIHIPVPLAKARKIPVTYSKPNEFVEKYMRYVLTRFLTEFNSVGLYVCPGEALSSRYQPEWIRDVIFAAAKASGKHPLIVVRDWTLDAKRFREVCVGQYDNLYTERKHNMEMLVSPVPDAAHRQWRGVAQKHIVNVHENSDVKPFRWGSPAFIQEMAANWKRLGLSGAEAYGMVSWRWPYSLDKLDPSQRTFWPAGPKLLTFERDEIWLAALERYLWKVDRDPAGERAYWSAWLGRRFGDAHIGKLLCLWYETTGPILPGFQNLVSYLNMNFYPTAVAREMTIDSILSGRADPDSGEQGTGNYGPRPVDSVFFERYKREYELPKLRNRLTMPVSEYADRLAEGRPPVGVMTPDRVSALLVRLAQEGQSLAWLADAIATVSAGHVNKRKAETHRFVTDSQALLLLAQSIDARVRAAIQWRLWHRTGTDSHAKACLAALRQSVASYRQLVALTDKTYVNASDMLLSLNWHNGLKACEDDLKTHGTEISGALSGALVYGSPGMFDVFGAIGTTGGVTFPLRAGTKLGHARLEFTARDLDGTKPGDEGVLRVAGHEIPLPPTGDGQTKPISLDLPAIVVPTGGLVAEFVLAHKPDNTQGYSIRDARIVAPGAAGSGSRGMSSTETLVSFGAAERKRMLDTYYTHLSGPRPFHAGTKAEWERHRAALRAHVRKRLGLDPWPARVPLDIQWGGELDRGEYRVRRVTYQTWPGFRASGWLYQPKLAGKLPVILNPHGHWALGAMEPVVQERLIAEAKLGYLAFAVDTVHLDDEPFSITAVRASALSCGLSDATVQVWNLVRALDVLETLPEADMARVGCTGESGGGLQTLYMMCVDPRIRVAAPAVYVCNVTGFMSAAAEQHCMCNYVPGVLSESDLPELAATFAPKPAIYLNVTRDWTANVPKREFPQIRAVYRLYGAANAVACGQWDYEHTYNRPMREAMYAFFNEHLLGKPGQVTEPPTTVETPETLRALDRPVPVTRPWSELADVWYAAHRARASVPADAHSRESFVASILNVLGDVRVHGALDGSPVGVQFGGLKMERLRVRSEAGIVVPAILARPTSRGKAPVALLLTPGGIGEAFASRMSLIRSLLDAGVAVLVPDVRLTGEMSRQWTRYEVFWGRPEVGMAVTDIRACVDVLQSLPGLDARRVNAIGLGASGATALVAGALEQRLRSILIERLGQTYANGRTAPLIAGLAPVADLPEIAALIAPRALTAGGLRPEDARVVVSSFRRAGAPQRLRTRDADLGDAEIVAAIR